MNGGIVRFQVSGIGQGNLVADDRSLFGLGGDAAAVDDFEVFRVNGAVGAMYADDAATVLYPKLCVGVFSFDSVAVSLDDSGFRIDDGSLGTDADGVISVALDPSGIGQVQLIRPDCLIDGIEDLAAVDDIEFLAGDGRIAGSGGNIAGIPECHRFRRNFPDFT